MHKKEKNIKIVMMGPESCWNEWQHFLGFRLLDWACANKQIKKDAYFFFPIPSIQGLSIFMGKKKKRKKL